jgi:hypothetical protein
MLTVSIILPCSRLRIERIILINRASFRSCDWMIWSISTRIKYSQDSPKSGPSYYYDRDFNGTVDNQGLNDHMGLHDVLGVLIKAVVKEFKDYSLCCVGSYNPSAGPITFAMGVSRFLKWWNDTRTCHLSTLYYYRRLPKDIDRRILSSRSIKHLSKLREYSDIEAWLRELTTRNKDFVFWTIFSWTHIKHLAL